MPVTFLNDLFLRLADLERERLTFTQDRRLLEEQLRQEKVKTDHAVRQAEKRYVQMQQDIHHLLQMSAAANASRARYQGWPLQTPPQVTPPEASAPRYASTFRPPATNPAFMPVHISPEEIEEESHQSAFYTYFPAAEHLIKVQVIYFSCLFFRY